MDFTGCFPYAIYYILENKVVSIHAVLDCRQDPKFIEQRLSEERTSQCSQLRRLRLLRVKLLRALKKQILEFGKLVDKLL